MAINYSICFPYCLSLLISIALRGWEATWVSVQMLQRNVHVLDVLCAGAEGLKPPQPCGQRGQRDPVTLGHWAKNVPLCCVLHNQAGSSDCLHLRVSAAGQDWENAADLPNFY